MFRPKHRKADTQKEKRTQWIKTKSDPVLPFRVEEFQESDFIQNQHAVAVTEETHTLLHGITIGFHDKLMPGKSRNQHQKRALRQMEIRQKHINGLHFARRINED